MIRYPRMPQDRLPCVCIATLFFRLFPTVMLEILSPYRRLRPEVGDYKKGARRIKCPVLLVNISTDSEFPPYWAEELAQILNESSPDQAQVKILDSPWGHMRCVQEGREIGKYISEFLGSKRLKGA